MASGIAWANIWQYLTTREKVKTWPLVSRLHRHALLMDPNLDWHWKHWIHPSPRLDIWTRIAARIESLEIGDTPTLWPMLASLCPNLTGLSTHSLALFASTPWSASTTPGPRLAHLHVRFRRPASAAEWEGLLSLNLRLASYSFDVALLRPSDERFKQHQEGLARFVAQQAHLDPVHVMQPQPPPPVRRRTRPLGLPTEVQGRPDKIPNVYTLVSTACCMALGIWILVNWTWS